MTSVPIANAVFPDGRLNDAFGAHACRLFQAAQDQISSSAQIDAEDSLAIGLYPDVLCFSAIKSKFPGLVSMRVPLADFKLDGDHQTIIHINHYTSLNLHTDIQRAIMPPSAHLNLHREYERVVKGNHLRDESLRAVFLENTLTPGMQGFLLDVRDPWGHLLATTIFQLGGRSAYAGYHMYRYDLRHNHIGRFGILAAMQALKETDACDYFYVGGFHPSHDRLRWKTRLAPAELLIDGAWTPLTARSTRYIKKHRQQPAVV